MLTLRVAISRLVSDLLVRKYPVQMLVDISNILINKVVEHGISNDVLRLILSKEDMNSMSLNDLNLSIISNGIVIAIFKVVD